MATTVDGELRLTYGQFSYPPLSIFAQLRQQLGMSDVDRARFEIVGDVIEIFRQTTRARVAQVAEAQHRAGRYLDYYKVQAEAFTSQAAVVSSPELRARYLRLAASYERLAKLAAGMAVAQPDVNSAAVAMMPERSRDLMTEAAGQQ